MLSCGSPSNKDNKTLNEVTEKTELTSDSLVISIQDITWSPDGKTIYFSGMRHMPDYSDYKPENWNIYKYELETKETIRIVDSALYVAVSPSGNQIAIGKIQNGNRDIYLSDKNGKNLKRITSHLGDDYAASFSPDETKLVFNSNRDGKIDIYVINTDTTGLKRLTAIKIDGGYDNPQWSPDGKRIVFYNGTSNGRDQIFVMNADGSNQKNITNDTLLNYFPGWIDNKQIIFTQNNKNGAETIYTMAPDGTDRKPLMDIQSFYARVSPNGEMIAYVNEKEQCISVITIKRESIVNIRFP